MQKLLLLSFVLLVAAASLYFWRAQTGWLTFKQDRQLIKLSLRENFLASEKKELLVELVKTPASARQGLSDRLELRSHDGQAIDGMLFVFASAQPLSFWMKDMHFDIDICWLKQRSFLACARQARAPADGEAPASFAAPGPADMVLETLPGFLSQEDLESKLFFK